MTEYPYELTHDAATTGDDEDDQPRRHATTCELLIGIQRRRCTCGLCDDEPTTGSDCA